MSIPSSPIGAGANPSAAQFAAAGKPLASTSSTGIGKQNPAKARKAAREFEAQLIETWLQSLEQTYSIGAGEDKLSGGDNYRYLGSQALATSLADHGGLGIARMLLHSLHIEDSQKPSAIPKASLPGADSNH